MDTTQIRRDLKQIRFYFSRKDMFTESEAKIGQFSIQPILDKYNAAICTATPQMYELYYELYINSKTHEDYADEYGYSVNYVYKLNHKLIQFLKTKLSA